MDENLLTITVSIADKNYPILIERKNEEEVRKAAKLLNDTILAFKNKYPAGADSKISPLDYVSMAAMQMAMKYMHLEAQKDIDVLAGELKDIDKELEDLLKSDIN